MIERNSDNWCNIVREIVECFTDGKLIPHSWLKHRFGLAKLKMADFEDEESFVLGLQEQQFAYMTLIDELRSQLLEQESLYIRNIRGDGYVVLAPSDQTKYGYDKFFKDMRKTMRDSELIMNCVRPVTTEQQAKDNDLRAKFGILKQMIANIRK